MKKEGMVKKEAPMKADGMPKDNGMMMKGDKTKKTERWTKNRNNRRVWTLGPMIHTM